MSTFAEQIPSSLKTDTIYLCERSIHSSFHVFSKLLKLSSEESFMLKEIYNGYAKKISIKGIIFIHSSVEECFKRAKDRNHLSDQCLSFEYMTEIHEKYMEWFAQTDYPVFYVSDMMIKESSVDEIVAQALEHFRL